MNSCCSVSRSGDAPTSPVPDAGRAPARASIALPGGTFLMGTDYERGFRFDGEGPVRSVTLDAFQIDTCPVTNGDFAAFVDATGYVTDSEQYGWSFVFHLQVPPGLVEDTAAEAPWWCVVRGAGWRTPEGPGSSVADRLDHPVVHVSWNDARAYAAWAGQSLPSEAQWEYAARGGLEQKLYPWGDELTPDGQHLCNIWQGDFPAVNTAQDGWAFTCPVDAFPANGHGLYSMTGNTWEWCADTWGADTGGVDTGGANTGGAGRVMKGGSFLCHESYCNRYRVAARTQNAPDSAASHIGFRCVRN